MARRLLDNMGRSPRDTVRTRRALQRIKAAQLSVDGMSLDLDNGAIVVQVSEDGGLEVLADGLAITDIYNETPSGTIDGVNDTFNLAEEPVPATLRVIRNGVEMRAGMDADFTLAGAVITFQPGAIPQAGDSLVAHYRPKG